MHVVCVLMSLEIFVTPLDPLLASFQLNEPQEGKAEHFSKVHWLSV
jgi:hypothetical protein